MNNATPPPNPSETPLVDAVRNDPENDKLDGLQILSKITKLARTLERRATLAERRCGELEGELFQLQCALRTERAAHNFTKENLLIQHQQIEELEAELAALTPKPEPKGEME